MSAALHPKLVMPVSDRDHIRGSSSAKVTLVEYGDYECPHCGRAFHVVKELERIFGDSLRVVFRNFPLSTIHEHAEAAAEAAEAAGAQNKFWEMHGLLFQNQSALTRNDLVSYAKAIGIDVIKFSRDLTEGRYVERVREDFASGVRSGVNGTPTFFINGIRHDGPSEIGSLLSGIKQAGG
jgi:protein-disulfide isomerase